MQMRTIGKGWKHAALLAGVLAMTGCIPRYSNYCAGKDCLYPLGVASQLRPDLVKGATDPMKDLRVTTQDRRCDLYPQENCIWLPLGSLDEENIPAMPSPSLKPLNLLETTNTP